MFRGDGARVRRRWRLLLATAAVWGSIGLAPLADAAPARPVVHTVPYDHGCLGNPPCTTTWTPAAEGTIHGVDSLMICVGYSLPPLPIPCSSERSTTAGVDVDVRRVRRITASAIVRSTAPVTLPDELAPRVCLGLAVPWHPHHSPLPGGGYSGVSGAGCKTLVGSDPVTLRTTFGRAILGPGTHILFVHVTDGNGQVEVERIVHRLHR